LSPELQPQAIPPSFFDGRKDTVLTWLGMAGALINARGTVLFIDPLITMAESDGGGVCESGHRLKIPLPIEARDVPRADAVLYTHADDDHFGRLTAETFALRLRPRFVAPPPVARALKDVGVEGERIVTARDFDSIRIGQAEVVVTPALHDWQEKDPWQRGDCCGYLIKTPDGTSWHPGDTRLIDELLEVRGVDLLFFDVAAVDAHLGPAGSARLAETCGAKAMIAYHYGTFHLPPGTFGSCDPRDSLPYVKELPARFLQLNPGELLRLPL
jgi:L-ascorbate metabolism protein UlaG (beta-lactamase superfamily)